MAKSPSRTNPRSASRSPSRPAGSVRESTPRSKVVASLGPDPVAMKLPRRVGNSLRETYISDRLLLPELGMLGWARFEEPSEGSLPPHDHQDFWEICYIVSGRADWWVANQGYEVMRGDIFITGPNEVHGGQDTMMHPCELYWVQISLAGKALPGLTAMQTRRLRHDFNALSMRQFPGSESLIPLYEQMLATHRSIRVTDTHAVMRCRAALHMLLLKVLEHGQQRMHDLASQRSRRTSRIERIIQWIDAHLDEPFDIAQLAKMADLGQSQFRARFLEEVGQSPMEYAIARRIAIAKQLLVTQRELAITRIAHQLGYASSQYFATVFKHHTGLTPGAYRERHQTGG